VSKIHNCLDSQSITTQYQRLQCNLCISIHTSIID